MIDIEPHRIHQVDIVPLSLQVLVDSAILHNQMSYETPLLVTIEIKQDYLVVTNLVRQLVKKMPRMGMGLKDLIRQYGDVTSQPVEISNRANVFVVKLPLLPATSSQSV